MYTGCFWSWFLGDQQVNNMPVVWGQLHIIQFLGKVRILTRNSQKNVKNVFTSILSYRYKGAKDIPTKVNCPKRPQNTTGVYKKRLIPHPYVLGKSANCYAKIANVSTQKKNLCYQSRAQRIEISQPLALFGKQQKYMVKCTVNIAILFPSVPLELIAAH